MSQTVQHMSSTLELLKKLKASSFLHPRRNAQSVPSSSSVLPQFLDMGLSPQQSQQLVHLLEQPATLLKHKTEAAMDNIHRILAERAPRQNPQIVATIQQTLQAGLLASIQNMQEQIMDSIYSRLRRRQSSPPQPARPRKPVFKHEFTPLLENLFAANRYPTTQDKAALAAKTGMTVKQIQDWFQNHRNRTKCKEGQAQKSDHSDSCARAWQSPRSMSSDSEEDEWDQAPVTKRPRISIEVSTVSSSGRNISDCSRSHQPIFDFFALPLDPRQPRPDSTTESHDSWQYPAEHMKVCRPSPDDWPRPPLTEIRQRVKQKKVDAAKLLTQLEDSFKFDLRICSSSRKRAHAELDNTSGDTSPRFVPWTYYRTHPTRHPASISNQLGSSLDQAKLHRKYKRLPRRPAQATGVPIPHRCSSSSSLFSTASSPSSSSRSSSQSTIWTVSSGSSSYPVTPESSPRLYQRTIEFTSPPKAFEAYAGPLLGLNQYLSI